MILARKLFCEYSSLTYRLSVYKCCLKRHWQNFFKGYRLAKVKEIQPLPVVVYSHKSLIRRKLGNVDMTLQENKAVNLQLASQKVNGIIIKPGQIFSFWYLVGAVTARKGYKEGLVIAKGAPSSGIGGGLCQFTNLIHWLVLHSPLEITEHHHHDAIDLFPDYGRQIPFGCGTSIMYNYLDYRFANNTALTFQLLVWCDEHHLCAELRANQLLPYRYHIKAQQEFFSREQGVVYRNNNIYRRVVDVKTGNTMEDKEIKANHAQVLYDTNQLVIKDE